LRHYGDTLARFLIAGGKLDRELETDVFYNSYATPGKPDMVKKVMTRIHLVPKSDRARPFAIRFHLFEDANETTPHNHHNNVLSQIFCGRYTHKVLAVVDAPDCEHVLSSWGDGEPDGHGKVTKVRMPFRGKQLVPVAEFAHEAPNVYFLEQSALHVVGAPASGSPVLTLFVKDKVAAATHFIAKDKRDLPTEMKPVLVESAEEKDALISKFEALIVKQYRSHSCGGFLSPE
jgi:hypothetical protein